MHCCSVMCAGTSCGSLVTWPKRALRRRRMISDIDGKPVVAVTSSFLINCCQLICSSCLWHFMWKVSRALMSVARGVQVSAAYNRTDWTRACHAEAIYCNHTPNDIRNAKSLSTFRTKLKNTLFTVAYSWWTYPPPHPCIDFWLTLRARYKLILHYITLHYCSGCVFASRTKTMTV